MNTEEIAEFEVLCLYGHSIKFIEAVLKARFPDSDWATILKMTGVLATGDTSARATQFCIMADEFLNTLSQFEMKAELEHYGAIVGWLKLRSSEV